MLYIDTACTYTEEYEPIHTYVFTGPCLITGKTQKVKIPGIELYNLRHKNGLIQDLLPSLTGSEREFVKTGFSKEGWEKLWDKR